MENSSAGLNFDGFYVQSMLFNTYSALQSFEGIVDVFAKLKVEANYRVNSVNVRHLLNYHQNVILHSAALSRYFWPVSKKGVHVSRGRKLREAFNVTEQSALKCRAGRNALEHFDERLDLYVKNLEEGFTVPEFMGVDSDRDGGNVRFFRAYFIDVMVFQVLDEKISIKPLFEEIIRIHDLLLISDEAGRFP